LQPLFFGKTEPLVFNLEAAGNDQPIQTLTLQVSRLIGDESPTSPVPGAPIPLLLDPKDGEKLSLSSHSGSFFVEFTVHNYPGTRHQLWTFEKSDNFKIVDVLHINVSQYEFKSGYVLQPLFSGKTESLVFNLMASGSAKPLQSMTLHISKLIGESTSKPEEPIWKPVSLDDPSVRGAVTFAIAQLNKMMVHPPPLTTQVVLNTVKSAEEQEKSTSVELKLVLDVSIHSGFTVFSATFEVVDGYFKTLPPLRWYYVSSKRIGGPTLMHS